jgi:hypothetical protein
MYLMMNKKNLSFVIMTLIFQFLFYSYTVSGMEMLEDIEAGIQPYRCSCIVSIKKGLYVASAWIGPAAGAFTSEIIAFHAINELSNFFGDDELPLPLYILAGCSSSLIGCLLGPRFYRVLRHTSA